jgi:hypothetical protein
MRLIALPEDFNFFAISTFKSHFSLNDLQNTKTNKNAIFGTHQIPINLHFAILLAKQNEKQHQNKKHKSTVVGETIGFNICNKPFKPLGIPSG